MLKYIVLVAFLNKQTSKPILKQNYIFVQRYHLFLENLINPAKPDPLPLSLTAQTPEYLYDSGELARVRPYNYQRRYFYRRLQSARRNPSTK